MPVACMARAAERNGCIALRTVPRRRRAPHRVLEFGVGRPGCPAVRRTAFGSICERNTYSHTAPKSDRNRPCSKAAHSSPGRGPNRPTVRRMLSGPASRPARCSPIMSTCNVLQLAAAIGPARCMDLLSNDLSVAVRLSHAVRRPGVLLGRRLGCGSGLPASNSHCLYGLMSIPAGRRYAKACRAPLQKTTLWKPGRCPGKHPFLWGSISARIQYSRVVSPVPLG